MAHNFKITNFRSNSFVIVEGKSTDSFFIIRQGKVLLNTGLPVPGEEPNQLLGPGDFFGVVSAMSGHPEIVTAQTLEQTSLITVDRSQFAVLIQNNAAIAIKILRYFSWRLRVIDRAITEHTFQNISKEDNPEHMFDIGKFYFQRKEYTRAVYAFQNYLKYFPNGQNSLESKSKLQAMNAQITVEPKKPRENLTHYFKDGQIIFIEHEPGTELYIIQEGRVKVTKVIHQNEVLLAVLQPGDIFGEMSLLENKPRSASVVAHGNVVTLAINKTNFIVMVKEKPQLAVKLITLISERIWIAHRQLSNLLISDPLGRVYDMLLTLIHKNNGSIEEKANYTFDITSAELINMLGFSQEEGERYIINLLEDKYFRLEHGKIICLDTFQLEKQVYFYRKKVNINNKA